MYPKYWKNDNGQYHREDGPAIENYNGDKEWYINGLRHRVDGPALEWKSGRKQWYINGQLHREDGPAIEWPNGDKEWFVNGKLHRLDGPACEWIDGTKAWFINGEKFDSKKEFNKKVAEMKKAENKDKPTEIDKFRNKYWRNDNGKLHREDGPAYEYADGTKEWYINGKLHRLDGPAIEYANGSKEWYLNDKLHREDGPAREYVSGYKEWWVNGQLHRLDGPAIEWVDGSKEYYIDDKKYTRPKFIKYLQEHDLPIPDLKDLKRYLPKDKSKASLQDKDKPTEIYPDGTKCWTNDKGQYHREDGPAFEGANGDKAWYFNGQRHRIDGPAREKANGDEEWWVNGECHRIDGPAFEGASGTKSWWINGIRYSEKGFYRKVAEIKKDKPTKIDRYENKYWENDIGQFHREDGPAIEYTNGSKQWWINGYPHRIDGPAVENVDGHKQWFINGQLHRIDGPALEWADGTKAWYVNGQCHRIDGPAIEDADGTKEWYLNGTSYSEEEFNKEVAEMNEYKSQITTDESGSKYWKNAEGLYHREDGPAIEWANGTKEWYLNGKLHRADGPAIEFANGSKAWYVNGKLHRAYGPAWEGYDGVNQWWFNGLPAKGIKIEEDSEVSLLKQEISLLKQQISELKQSKEIVSTEVKKESIADNKTITVFTDAGTNALKLAGARQSSRVLTSFCKILLTSVAKYFGQEEQMKILDTEAGDALLEIISPLLIHALANNKIIPKYSEQIEAVAKLSIEANTSYYAMHYSDKIFDITKNIMSDEETRNKFKQIISMGSNILNKENIESLDYSKSFESILA